MPRPLSAEDHAELTKEGAPGYTPKPPPKPFTPSTEPESDSEPREGDALGRSKYSFAFSTKTLDDAKLAQIAAIQAQDARIENRPDALIKSDRERLLESYTVMGPRGPIDPEAASDLLDAYESPDTAAKQRKRASAGAFPIPGRAPTALDQDERWRTLATEFSRDTSLADVEAAANKPIPADEAENKPWASMMGDAILDTISLPLAALSPIDSAAHHFGYNIPVVPTGEEVEGIGGKWAEVYGRMVTDPDADVLLDPSKAAKVGQRVVSATGIVEAEGELLNKLGLLSPTEKAAWDQVLEHATRIPDFDAAAKAMYDDGDTEQLDALPFASLPKSLRTGMVADRLAEAVAVGGQWRDDPRLAGLQAAVDAGEGERFIELQANKLPVGVVRRMAPSAAPSNDEVTELYKKRAQVHEATGGPEADAAMRIMGGMMVEPLADGTLAFKPTKVQRMMAYAGMLPELYHEAELPIGQLPNPVAWTADALGYENLAGMLMAVNIPSKAGWEAMVATRAYDPLLHELGWEGSEAPLLREGVDTTWVGRQMANLAMPDYQGPGWADALRRQGEAESSALSKWVTGADIAADILMPLDDVIAGGLAAPISAGRRGYVAAKVGSRVGLRGRRLAKAAVASAVPVVVGETDSLAALHKTVKAGVIQEVESGNRIFNEIRGDSRSPKYGTPKGAQDYKLERDWGAKIELAGLNADETAKAVNAIADERAGLIVDEVARMLGRGGGPADVALRKSPEYLRVKGRYADLVASKQITQKQADGTMALLESNAKRAAAKGKFATPEDFFTRHDVEMGGTPGAGAYFQGEGTPDFARWFGDSKVVDADGNPLVVYHGTDAKIEAFATVPKDGAGSMTGARTAKLGAFFTDNPNTAADFADLSAEMRAARRGGGSYDPTRADSQVYPVYLSIRNPLDLNAIDVPTYDALSSAFPGIAGVIERAEEVAQKPTSAAREMGRSQLKKTEIMPVEARWEWDAEQARIDQLKSQGMHVERSLHIGDFGKKQSTLTYYPKRFAEPSDGAGDMFEVLRKIASNPDARATLESLGYDGIKVRTEVDAPRYRDPERMNYDPLNREQGRFTQYIAFAPNQIKSAIGNRGTFDPKNPNILYSRDAENIHGSIQKVSDRHPLDTTPDEVGPVRRGMSLAEVESAIRSEPKEHLVIIVPDGRHVGRWLGDTDLVGYSPEVRAILADAVAAHNHPRQRSLSGPDLAAALHADLAEIRAVMPDGTVHAIRRPDVGWGESREWLVGEAMNLQGEAIIKAKARMREIILAAGGNPKHGSAAVGFDLDVWEQLLTEEHYNAVESFLRTNAPDSAYVVTDPAGIESVRYLREGRSLPAGWKLLLAGGDDTRLRRTGGRRFEQRTGTGIHGSIEPKTADWLIRFFSTADIGTVLHENAHLMRFVMGDDWVDELVNFFDHEPDLTRPGKNKLTVKGEEQFADGFARLLRGRIAPSGRVRAYLDEFKDQLSDVWLRMRGLPMGVPPKFRVWFDAALNPGAPLRKIAIDVSAERLPQNQRAGTTDAHLPNRLEGEKIKRINQVVGDVSTVDSPGAEIDVAIGSRSATEVDALDAASSVIADMAVETARRQWGFTGDVVKLTRRSVVPVNRKDEVLRRVDATMGMVVADPRRFVQGADVILPPVEAAKMRSHVAMLADSGLGYEALRHGEILDPARDFTSLTVTEYNRIREATIDREAGPGSRMDRVAAENVGNAAVSALHAAAAVGDTMPVIGRVKDNIKKAFVVQWASRELLSPPVAEVVEDITRQLGDISGWFIRTLDDVKKLNPKAGRDRLLREIGKAIPSYAVNATDVDELLAFNDKWVDRNVVTSAIAKDAANPPAAPTTVADLLIDLDAIASLFARNAPKGSAQMDAEYAAILYLQGWKASPQDLTTLVGPDKFQLEESIGLIHDGIRRRWGAVSQAAQEIGITFAGSDEQKVWVGLAEKSEANPRRAKIYKHFFDGEWNEILSEMAKIGQSTSPQSNFDPTGAVIAAITRLRGLHILSSFSERMADLGIAADVDTYGRTGRQFEAFTPIGATDRDRAVFRDEVLHYLQAESSWKMTAEVVLDKTAKKVVERNDAPGAKTDHGPFNPEAYRVAMSILQSWGFKLGKDTEWKMLVLPNGEEVFVPAGMWTELKAVMDRGAKAGLAWTEQAESVPILGRFYKMTDLDPALAKHAGDRENTLGRRVSRVVGRLLDLAGWSYSMSRVNMVTGVGIPNPANFIGNLFGGMIQALEGKGAVGTLRMIGRYGSPTASGKVLRRMWLSMFSDYSGIKIPWDKAGVWVDGRGMIHTADSLAEMAIKHGLHTSQARAESALKLVQALRDNEGTFFDRILRDGPLENAVIKPFKYWQNLLMETSTGIDNLYRAAAFVDELSIGKSGAEAAEVARRVSFDYNAVTDVERDFLRPIVMFYTYQRRNLDLQWWTLLNHPTRFLGSVRGIRDAQEYFAGDESELIWPEYLDGRLIVSMNTDTGHPELYEGVGKITPPMPPSDVMVLMARLYGTVNLQPEPLRETLSMLSPWAQFPVAMALNQDIFGGRDLDAFNTVPAGLVEFDQQLFGGILTEDVFKVRYDSERDPLSESSPNAPHYQAQNGRYWWMWRNLMPIFGGRTTDTITAMARADWGASLIEGGFVQAAVDAARTYRNPSPGSPDTTRLVDPLVSLVRDGVDWLPGLDPGPDREFDPSPREDTDEMRVGVTRDAELGQLGGLKAVLIPTRTLKLDDIAKARSRAIAEKAAEVRKSDPSR